MTEPHTTFDVNHAPLLHAWEAALSSGEADHSTHTRRAYSGAVARFLVWYAEQNHEPFLPHRLTPIDLTGYRTYLQQRQAVTSVNAALAALRKFAAWLHASG